MRKALTLILAAATATNAVAAAVAQSRDRAKVAVSCTPAEARFAYDCTLRVTNARTGELVDGAKLVVGADMPSMPMAHNVKPAEAQSAGQPGLYKVRLGLEMHGEWAVRMRITGPLRDEVVEVLDFDNTGSGPRGRHGAGSGPGSGPGSADSKGSGPGHEKGSGAGSHK